MNDKTSLKIALGVLGVVIVILALWRVLAYEPGHSATPTSPTSQTAPYTSSQDYTGSPHKKQLLDELLPENEKTVSQKPVLQTTSQQPIRYPHRTRLQAYPTGRATPKQKYTRPASPTHDQRYVDTNFYTQDTKSGTASAPAANTSYTYRNNARGNAKPQVNFQSSAAAKVQEERARALSPYLRPNRKEREQMDAKWAKLSAAIDRAVAQALYPKSKKEAMIGKYSSASPAQNGAGGYAGLDGAYAPVANALSAQKNDIVKSFGSAFGGRAAQQAGNLMDSYAQELAGALNMPNASPQEKEQKVKEISNKYQKEMDKLADKNQYDKFVAQRVEQDNKQKQELGALYPDFRESIDQIIDQAREKDLALATQNLPREDYFKALAQNSQDMNNHIKEVITQGGKSVNDFYKWQNKNAENEVRENQRKEEEGEIQSVARKASVDETRNMKAQVATQRKDILESVSKGFGPQAKGEFEAIIDRYEADLNNLYQEEKTVSERTREEVKLLKDVNRALLDKQMEQVEKMNIPAEQKEQTLKQLREAYNNIN